LIERLAGLGGAALGEVVMSSFSPVNDALEGFRLIGRRPVSVLVWVVLWGLLAIGPIIAGVVLAWPHLADTLSNMRDQGGGAMMNRMAQFQMTVWSLLGPWILWVFAVQTLINTAIFRAVLEPRAGGFAGLKLGMEEVHQFLLQIILFVLWTVFVCILFALGVGAVVAARQAPPELTGWLIALAVIVLICVAIHVLVRMSLAGPMTFALKRLEVFGSWRKTRGRFWGLLGMVCVAVIFVIAVGLVVGALRNIAFFGLNWGRFQGLDRLGDDPRAVISALMAAMGPGLIAAMIIHGLAQTVMRIILLAPFAAAYRDLSGTDPAPAAAGYDAAPAHG
jgi:hypothetical protein